MTHGINKGPSSHKGGDDKKLDDHLENDSDLF